MTVDKTPPADDAPQDITCAGGISLPSLSDLLGLRPPGGNDGEA